MRMSKGHASQTPVMRQYLTAKAAHSDALLLFRMGDFYELFYEDAVVAARALDLTLTARNKGAPDEVPMAGVPHHAASAYVQKLLEQGFKVAICEQMADPTKVKGIVPREDVRVVSPGIAYDDAGLQARQNHYLVAIEAFAEGRGAQGPFGVAALDLSTGELLACEADDEASALAELVRLDPHELLVGPGASAAAAPLANLRARAVVREVAASLATSEADAILDTQLGAGEARSSLAPTLARRAAARCVVTARTCEAGRPLPISRLVFYSLGDTLVLDESTQAHLELVVSVEGTERGSLLSIIDATQTAPGARLLRRRLLAPLTRVAEIRRRHDAVELFVAHPGLRQEVRGHLAEVGDIERLAVKLALDRAAPRDLAALRRSLAVLPLLAAALARCPDPGAREALGVAERAPAEAEGESGGWMDLCAEASGLLARALSDDPPLRASDGGVLRDGFDPALDEARELLRGGQRLIVELEVRLRESSAIPSLKLRYTRVFGWYIEVTKSHLEKALQEPAAQANDRQRRALHLRRARCPRRQARPRRRARFPARERGARQRCARARSGALALARGRGVPRGLGCRERPRRCGPPGRLGASGD